MYSVKLLLLILNFLVIDAMGQAVKKPAAPDNIEIVLNTDGDLKLDGVPAGVVTTNKAQNSTNEKLVKQFGTPKEAKVFTTKAEAKNGKKHELLTVDIPDGALVTLQTQTGNIAIDNVNATVSAYVQKGNVSLNNLKGELELVSKQGDITATGVEARGTLIARNGNVRLTDATGLLDARAPMGKVSVSIGKEYHKKSPKPLDVRLVEGDITIDGAPYGGKVQLGKGALTISGIAQPMDINAEAAQIALLGVGASLTLRNRGDVSIQLVKFVDKKSEAQEVNMEIQEGDVTLELAKNFVGSLEIWTTEANPTVGKSPVTSMLPLGQIDVADKGLVNGQVNIKDTTQRIVVGKGLGPKVLIHVTNGKVIIKN